jgi:hypothetical protein
LSKTSMVMEKAAVAALLEGRLVSACGPDIPPAGGADVDALSGTDAPSISSVSRSSSPQLLPLDQCTLVGEKVERERNGRGERRLRALY